MAPSDREVWSAEHADRRADDGRSSRQPSRQPPRRPARHNAARPPEEQRPTGPERPREVRTAIVLLVVLGAVLSFVGAISIAFAELTGRELRQLVVESGQTMPIEDDQFTMLIRITGGIILAVGIAHAVAAHGVRKARSWGRIVGYVAAGIVAAICLIAAVQGLTDVSSIVLLAAAVGAIAFLAQRPVSDYLSPERRKESS